MTIAPSRRRLGVRIAAVAVAGTTVLALAPAAVAASRPPAAARSEPRAAGQSPGTDLRMDLRGELEALVRQGGSTAALAEVRDRGRVAWRGTAGTADLALGDPVRADGRFRTGSVTKTFVATVVLQLVGEGRVRLDDPIERGLPGEVPGGGAITVRQLLNHTSGLANYLDDPRFAYRDEASVRRYLAEGRWIDYRPQQLVDIANSRPPYFEPGRGWHYSNTNYVLLGMLIERTTGRTWRQEVSERVLWPLGLRDTLLPTSDTRVPGPAAHTYAQLPEGPADITRLNPSVADASGSAISTAGDLNRFHAALFGGRLLRPAEFAEMTTTVPVAELHGGYGLGVARIDTPCGEIWGHTGDIRGAESAVFGTRDGSRQFTLSYQAYDRGDPGATDRAYESFVTAAACALVARPASG
ncbi:serine hydrolase domain-containing protein [Kitasatospora sp. NPDC091207]|uniref:serine hydrolase domain-containing protein n=1 Tax=Kitasatospora sp. NPDC091207 TaxID=3364083 RepID=UPI0037F9482F